MKYRVSLNDSMDLIVVADSEVAAVRKAKAVKDALSARVSDAGYILAYSPDAKRYAIVSVENQPSSWAAWDDFVGGKNTRLFSRTFGSVDIARRFAKQAPETRGFVETQVKDSAASSVVRDWDFEAALQRVREKMTPDQRRRFDKFYEEDYFDLIEGRISSDPQFFNALNKEFEWAVQRESVEAVFGVMRMLGRKLGVTY